MSFSAVAESPPQLVNLVQVGKAQEILRARQPGRRASTAGLSDDQLTGVMSAVRRLESRAAWTLMAAMREFAHRRPAADGAAGFDEFAADELTGTLHLTRQSAAAQIDYACAVAARLPRTFAALAPEPGVLVWRTPSGRTYTSIPTVYPI